MILYNVTINIENDIKEEWLNWVQTTYIPKVMKTNSFTEYKMFKLLNEEDNGGTTYCIQYFANNIWDIEDYQQNYCDQLNMELYRKYKDKLVLFSTILEAI